MVPSRDQVFTALFNIISDLPGFTSWSRRMCMPGDVTPEICPTLRLWEKPSETMYDGNRLPKDEWLADIVIYFFNPNLNNKFAGDPDLPAGMTILNPLIDIVRDALRPTRTNLYQNYNDLGLGVQGMWCRIEGEMILESGDTDPRGLGGAIIPIRILVPTAP